MENAKKVPERPSCARIRPARHTHEPIAGRYLEVFAQHPIRLHYAGIIPQVIPVEVIPCRFDSDEDRRIYDVCINTMKLCMMEHYVDCPWREQNLYALDARNQMLFGYHAFMTLDAGSTTVWETIKGAWDFEGNGSMCHAWSAVPVYVYHKLGMAKK